ncbi:MAG: 4-(cytidine 5'-diphospho)-2-C-methyl-D-erythritol kinase [Candidatus Binataceae bacterium]
MVKLISAFAPAKLNLFLRVTGRRNDGYHELDSIFVPISLGDVVQIEVRDAQGPSDVLLECDDPTLPSDGRNLAMRAAQAFLERFAIKAAVRLELIKRVPVGAGLGGGSSDAGTVLRVLAYLLRIDATEVLAEIALKLGADVPFFLDPKPARVCGIGEQITSLPNFARLAFVIALPPFEASTALVFHSLRSEDWSGKAADRDVEQIISGRAHSALLVNDLAKVTAARFPQITELRSALENTGALGAAMSGSGSAVFGVFRTYDEAVKVVELMSDSFREVKFHAVTIYQP